MAVCKNCGEPTIITDLCEICGNPKFKTLQAKNKRLRNDFEQEASRLISECKQLKDENNELVEACQAALPFLARQDLWDGAESGSQWFSAHQKVFNALTRLCKDGIIKRE